MKDPREIVLEPILTEKALRLQEEANKYVFKVNEKANKVEIKEAVAKRFFVKVKGVSIVNVKGKPRQRFTKRGRVSGFTSKYKKAIVTLEAGETLEFIENI
jgi:large subunit ribosomal protein L23